MSGRVGYSNVVTDGLVLYLDAGNRASYPGSGNTWYDLSGNNNHGTLTNGPTYNSTNGGTIVFDGTDDYVITPSLPSMNSWTAEIFCYTGNPPKYQILFDLNTSIRMQINGIYGTGGLSRFQSHAGFVSGPTWIYSQLESNTVISSSVWYHTTVTVTPYLGSGPSGRARQYVNGILETYEDYTNQGSTLVLPLNIGRGSWNGDFLEGRISVAKLYNRVLSDSEVLQNYNALKGRFGL